jgi:hypothetical protein
MSAVRVGLFDHFGWAVMVTAAADHRVVDRRRIELVETGVTPAPIHYESKRLDVAGTSTLVAEVRASIARAASTSFDELESVLDEPVESLSLRKWPVDFPDDMAMQMRTPYEARADAIMYRHVLADLAGARGWHVHQYDAKRVIAEATALLGDSAGAVLDGPRVTLGPPWTKDHRVALAATIVAD